MGRDRDSRPTGCLYVGNLPPDVRTREVEDIFSKYGRIKFIDVKARSARGQPFAFIEYSDAR